MKGISRARRKALFFVPISTRLEMKNVKMCARTRALAVVKKKNAGERPELSFGVRASFFSPPAREFPPRLLVRFSADYENATLLSKSEKVINHWL